MTNDLFNVMTNGSKFSYENLQKLQDINTKAFNKLARLQMSFAQLGIESTVEQARLFTDSRSYEDLLSAETDLASSYSDKMMELTREVTDIVSESQEDLVSWLEKCFEEGKKQAQPKAPASQGGSTQSAQSKARPAAKKTSAKSGQSKAA